jgi:chromosome segregation ATPase
MSDQAATKADIENVVNLIQQLAERMDQRFDAVDRRFEALEQRMDRLENRMTALEFQMAGINRNLDQSGRTISSLAATQAAQQRAIDELAARVTRLEENQKARA